MREVSETGDDSKFASWVGGTWMATPGRVAYTYTSHDKGGVGPV